MLPHRLQTSSMMSNMFRNLWVIERITQQVWGMWATNPSGIQSYSNKSERLSWDSEAYNDRHLQTVSKFIVFSYSSKSLTVVDMREVAMECASVHRIQLTGDTLILLLSRKEWMIGQIIFENHQMLMFSMLGQYLILKFGAVQMCNVAGIYNS